MVKSFVGHSKNIYRIKQSPYNCSFFATCSDDLTVKIWDFDFNLFRTFTGHSGYVPSLEWISSDLIASGSGDNTAKVWSISTGIIQLTISTGSYTVCSLKLLSNGFYLALGLETGKIPIYNINTGSLINTLTGHTNRVYDFVLINDDILVSSCFDFSIRIWNLTTYTQDYILNGHTNKVESLKQISSDLIASGSDDTTIKMWNTTSGSLIRTLSNHTNIIDWSLDLWIIGDLTRLLSGSQDKTIKIWDWSTGECLQTINTGLVVKALMVLNSLTSI